MKKQTTESPCDSAKLDALLLGDLSREEAAAVESHLSKCDHCAEQIQRAAVPGTTWTEARSMLALDEFDGLPSVSAAASLYPAELDQHEHLPTADLLAREIRGWLDPTDDPKSIGRFAGYEIVGIVGHGGMGIVLKGFETSLNRFVAIKVLAPRLATNGSARQRFAREAQATAAVRHDNVIAIHRVDHWHGLPFLVMPYIGGVSLQKRIDAEGPLSIEPTLRIGMQIAAGLAAAHAQGLVHRDIKPANILLEQGVERVTITDFGLARAADDVSVTRTGVIAGTPGYMSPEQAEAKRLDARSDLFSLGSVLYTMATGRPPFRGEGSFEVLNRIVREPARDMRDIEPNVPQWFARLVNQLHAKMPEARPQSAEEVAELLRDALAHVQQPDTVPPPKQIHPPTGAAGATKLKSQGAQRPTEPAFGKLKLRTGAMTMFTAITLGLCGLFFWQSTAPPDISGKWSGPTWGRIELQEAKPGKYAGSFGELATGTLELKWSRVERRFNGTWQHGDDRFGKVSVRLVDDKIRGAWTTSQNSRLKQGTPKLADLTWVRSPVDGAALQTIAGQPPQADPTALPRPLAPRSPIEPVAPRVPSDLAPAASAPVADLLGDPRDDPTALEDLLGKADRPAEYTNSVGMHMKLVAAGAFKMGNGKSVRQVNELTPLYSGARDLLATESPQHRVVITRPYYLTTTEVTQGHWERVMGSRPWQNKSFVTEGPDFPATWMTWSEAEEFCKRLSLKERKQYRLPSEAEWEYACRAGSTSIFAFGDERKQLQDHGWFTDNAYGEKGAEYAHQVARRKPNPWGFYDMHGNVWEWCQDRFGPEYFAESSTTNPTGPAAGSKRVIRGGGWRSAAFNCRSASRFAFPPDDSGNELGFRVVSVPDEPASAQEAEIGD